MPIIMKESEAAAAAPILKKKKKHKIKITIVQKRYNISHTSPLPVAAKFPWQGTKDGLVRYYGLKNPPSRRTIIEFHIWHAYSWTCGYFLLSRVNCRGRKKKYKVCTVQVLSRVQIKATQRRRRGYSNSNRLIMTHFS